MGMLRAWLAAPLLATVTLVALGCASPPEAEQKAAETAVSAAKAAGADEYAPDEFQSLMNRVTQAERQMADKAYKEAKATWAEVAALAQKAARTAEAAKAAMQAQVERQVGELEKRWETLRAEAEAASKRLKKDAKEALDSQAKNVAEALEAAKQALGNAPAAAREKLGAVGAALEKWERELRALIPPAKGKPGATKKPS